MSVRTQKHGKLEYLVSEEISVPHCFTTRLGGVSQGYLESLNLGANRGDDPQNVRDNYAILADAIGFAPENLVLTRQEHTDLVRVVTKGDHLTLDHRDYPVCDALVTRDPGTALVVFTADCTPILLYDPVTGAVGAIHAGWRGTAADIAGKTVEKMVDQFGCRPGNIRAAIGPNLGICCFETDADVPQAMIATFGDQIREWIQPAGHKFYVNLKEINAHALLRRGVTRIDISRDCTMCSHQRYWSHRFTGGIRGSQGAIILCKEAE